MFRRPALLAVSLALILSACGDKTAAPAPATEPTAPPAANTDAAIGEDGLTGQPVVDPSKGPPINESDAVGRRLMEKYPAMELMGVDPVPGTNLYEIRTTQWEAGTVGYTDEDVTYVYVNGDLYIGKSGEIQNYTQQNANSRVFGLIQQLPFDKALTFTYGAGRRTVVIFEDPDCPRCQDMEQEFKQIGAALNMTVRVLPFPLTQLHPEAEQRARHIFCADNPEGAWSEWMTSADARKDWAAFAERHPADPNCERGKAVDQVLAVADRLGLNQTPILMFDNGMTFEGQPTIEELERSFQFVEQAKANGQGISAPPQASAPSAAPPATSPPATPPAAPSAR